jgi:GSH-dependent disulfide-bond oxidoreductase
MIDVHIGRWLSGRIITIFLEETGLEYRIIPMNIGKGDQIAAEFAAIGMRSESRRFLPLEASV